MVPEKQQADGPSSRCPDCKAGMPCRVYVYTRQVNSRQHQPLTRDKWTNSGVYCPSTSCAAYLTLRLHAAHTQHWYQCYFYAVILACLWRSWHAYPAADFPRQLLEGVTLVNTQKKVRCAFVLTPCALLDSQQCSRCLNVQCTRCLHDVKSSYALPVHWIHDPRQQLWRSAA
jgi:hypothetical protein